VERRRKTATRNIQRGVNKAAASKDSAGHSLHLPHLADLIKDGEITIGMLNPVGCVATACDGDSTLAMLVRREDETFTQLLSRLDRAVRKAYYEGLFTDEINPPSTNSQCP
jgi:hypothetical protein